MEKDVICVSKQRLLPNIFQTEIFRVFNILVLLSVAIVLSFVIILTVSLDIKIIVIVLFSSLLGYILVMAIIILPHFTAPVEVCYDKQSKTLYIKKRNGKIERIKICDISKIITYNYEGESTVIETKDKIIPLFNGSAGDFGIFLGNEFKKECTTQKYEVKVKRKYLKISKDWKYWFFKITKGRHLFSEVGEYDLRDIDNKIGSKVNKIMAELFVTIIISLMVYFYVGLNVVHSTDFLMQTLYVTLFGYILGLLMTLILRSAMKFLMDLRKWIQILDNGIRIFDLFEEEKFIPKSDIEKFTLNTKKKRIEIQLKNGEKIVLRRGRREMKERFSEIRINELQSALRKLGVSYEIV